MKYHGLCAVAASALFLSVSAADFGSFLEKRAGIWSSGAADLVRDYPGKFRWLDQSKKQARAIRTKTDPLTLYGDPLQEVIVTLDGKKQLGSVVLSIYNRGDAGEWDRDRFEEKLDLVRDKLSGFAGGKKPENRMSRCTDSLVTWAISSSTRNSCCTACSTTGAACFPSARSSI